jgi:hypothetical protein
MKKYEADYSWYHGEWCVFERLSASIRVVHEKCTDKGKAVKLAERLNEKEEVK